MARQYCWRTLHAGLRRRFGADLLRTAQAGQQGSRFVGGVFTLVAIALEAANKLHLLATLFPLANADYLRVLDPEQLHALAYLSTRSHGYGFGVSLIFFGCVCLVLGYLIYRSGYLPRIIGVLLVIAGLGYLINSFALILAPALATRLFPWVLLPAFPAELGLCLWLLVKGVNVQRRQEQASAAGASI